MRERERERERELFQGVGPNAGHRKALIILCCVVLFLSVFADSVGVYFRFFSLLFFSSQNLFSSMSLISYHSEKKNFFQKGEGNLQAPHDCPQEHPKRFQVEGLPLVPPPFLLSLSRKKIWVDHKKGVAVPKENSVFAVSC